MGSKKGGQQGEARLLKMLRDGEFANAREAIDQDDGRPVISPRVREFRCRLLLE